MSNEAKHSELEYIGANDYSKSKMIKAFLRIQRLDLFCLQETKVQMMTKGLVRSIGFGRFLSWEVLDVWELLVGCLSCGTKEV